VEPDVLLEDYDPQLLAEARRKRDGIREKDLKNHMMNEDRLAENEGEKKVDRGDFSDEELRQLTSESSEKDDSKTSKEKLAKWGPDPLRPKHDYQVLEAVNYLKSYSIFKRLATEELGGEPKEKKVATGERDSSQ
jgi:carboxyl-terminal processing protease